MANWYVDGVGGSDSNGGTDPASDAKLTIQAGLNLAATAGDIVHIMATGSYTISARMTFPSSGTVLSPKVMVGANASGVVDGTKATITDDGSDTFMLNPNNRSFWTIANIIWVGAGQGVSSGILKGDSTARGIVVVNCDLSAANDGMQMSTGTTGTYWFFKCTFTDHNFGIRRGAADTKLVCKDCTFFDIDEMGIDSLGDVTIVDGCVFQSIGTTAAHDGIHTDAGLTHLTVVNSTFDNITGDGIGLVDTTGVVVAFLSNLIFSNGVVGIRTHGSNHPVMYFGPMWFFNNSSANLTGIGTVDSYHQLEYIDGTDAGGGLFDAIDPEYENTVGNDYTLSSDSPALGTAVLPVNSSFGALVPSPTGGGGGVLGEWAGLVPITKISELT